MNAERTEPDCTQLPPPRERIRAFGHPSGLPPALRDELIRRIRELLEPIHPIPVEESQLNGLPLLVPQEARDRCASARSVLFDVYGTIVVSGSGDIGVLRHASREDALAGALQACGLAGREIDEKTAGHMMEEFFGAIDRRHARARARGIEAPEVDILEVWLEVIERARREGLLPRPHADDAEHPAPGEHEPETPPQPATASAAERRIREAALLAVEYECRVNPVWPMPGAGRLLAFLRGRGVPTGIVSNSQFYTPLVMEVCFGAEPAGLGFDPELCAWSWVEGVAKPSADLFEPVVRRLGERGITPDEVIYLGNDMLNDILPACRLGLTPILFAGDARSLRLRSGDSRTSGVGEWSAITSLDTLAG